MATANVPNAKLDDEQDNWPSTVTALVEKVDGWAKEMGWKTHRVTMRMNDSQIGVREAPALQLEAGTTQLLLEPIARSSPSDELRVDLYEMPAYDDIAQLYFSNGKWELLYLPVDSAIATTSRVEPKPLSKTAMQEILQVMRRNAS